MSNKFEALMNCGVTNDGSVDWSKAMVDNGTTTDAHLHHDSNCYDWWHTHYYPVYYPALPEDKGKKAIEIVKVLMEEKAIKINTIKQFVTILDKLMQVL